MKIVFEEYLKPGAVDVEDGGQAKIYTFEPVGDSALFVRLQSWDQFTKHSELAALLGKTVRVTVETVDYQAPLLRLL